MAISIKEFRESEEATPEQLAAIDQLIVLGRQESALVDEVNAVHLPYEKAAQEARRFYGRSFVQVADLLIEQEIGPAGTAAAAEPQARLDAVRKDYVRQIVAAVEVHDLGHLAYIQKNYVNFVGEPLPSPVNRIPGKDAVKPGLDLVGKI